MINLFLSILTLFGLVFAGVLAICLIGVVVGYLIFLPLTPMIHLCMKKGWPNWYTSIVMLLWVPFITSVLATAAITITFQMGWLPS